MHSSRMRTDRSLLYGGGLPDRGPPGQRPPWTETPLDREPSRQRPPWTENSPVDRQTPAKTLPSQTLFAGGKNVHLPRS